jgi:hypothetical protein
LAFASSEIISDSTIRAMGLYRLKKRKRDSEFKPVYQKIRMLKKLPQDEFIKKYAERLPEDQLTKFINFIIEEHDAV